MNRCFKIKRLFIPTIDKAPKKDGELSAVLIYYIYNTENRTLCFKDTLFIFVNELYYAYEDVE